MEIVVGGYVAASWLLEREPKQWHAPFGSAPIRAGRSRLFDSTGKR